MNGSTTSSAPVLGFASTLLKQQRASRFWEIAERAYPRRDALGAAFRALWAHAARMDVFIRNWRTCHLRVALGMSITQDTCRTMAPAVLVVVGQSLTGLVHYSPVP